MYRFIIIFSGVIIVGLFNLILSIYSARDIGKRWNRKTANVQTALTLQQHIGDIYIISDGEDVRLTPTKYRKGGHTLVQNTTSIFSQCDDKVCSYN